MHTDISVIIPTYNVESFIDECLKSIANQTFNGTLECIIVDDCCTDKTIDVVNKFIDEYNGSFLFKVLRQNRNQGQAAARNKGIAEAKGTYIFFLDSDDFITKECLQLLFDITKKDNKIDLVQAGMDTIWGETIFSCKDMPDIVNDWKWIKKKFHLPNGLTPGPCNRLIKRDLINKYNIFFPEGIIYEDVPFTFHLAQHLSCIAFCNQQTYIYRTRRPGSTITEYNDEKALDSRIIVLNKLIELIDDKGLSIQARALMQKLFMYVKIHKIENLTKHHDDFKQIFNRLQIIMPWYYKIPSMIYFSLPLNIKKQKITDIVSRYIF